MILFLSCHTYKLEVRVQLIELTVYVYLMGVCVCVYAFISILTECGFVFLCIFLFLRCFVDDDDDYFSVHFEYVFASEFLNMFSIFCFAEKVYLENENIQNKAFAIIIIINIIFASRFFAARKYI